MGGTILILVALAVMLSVAANASGSRSVMGGFLFLATGVLLGLALYVAVVG